MKDSKVIKYIFSILIIIGLLFLISFLAIDLFEPIKSFVNNNDIKPLKETIEGYGFWRFFFVSLIHCIQVLFTFLPAEPIQIVAGVTCGPIYGFLCCLIGVFVGNNIIYFLVRFFKHQSVFSKYPVEESEATKKIANANKKASTTIILSLYFTPAIPYGVIAFTAARSKMSYLRYILVTTLGAIPSIFLCIAFGKFFIQGYFVISLILVIFFCIVIFVCSKFGKKLINNLTNQSYRASAIWIIIYLIEFSVLLFFFKKGSINGLLATILTIVFTSVFYALFNKQLSLVFEKLNRKYDIKYFQGPVKKGNPFLYAVFVFFTKLYFFNRFKVKINKDKLTTVEEPSILLFNHPSAYDFIYSFAPYYPKHRVHPVLAYYYFCNRHLAKLVHCLGAFPKYLFQPDISAMKNISRVIKDNGIIALAPEGRLSAYGEMENFVPSTAKLIKKLGVQVNISKIHGSYLTKPKWAKSSRRGQIEVEFKEVFNKEELKTLSLEEIYNRLYEALYYDDFKWQEEKHIKYKGKNFAEGLEQILYVCPVCHKEFTYSSDNNKITCNNCHTEVILNNYYEFETKELLIPKNIKEWYLFQKEYERKNIEDDNYVLSSNVTLKMPDPDGKGFKIVGKGVTTLTHKGITYKGTINNEEIEKFFKIENLPALPFGVKEDFEIYHDNTLYYFIPENIRECVKWSVVEEVIYERYVKDNNINLLE